MALSSNLYKINTAVARITSSGIELSFPVSPRIYAKCSRIIISGTRIIVSGTRLPSDSGQPPPDSDQTSRGLASHPGPDLTRDRDLPRTRTSHGPRPRTDPDLAPDPDPAPDPDFAPDLDNAPHPDIAPDQTVLGTRTSPRPHPDPATTVGCRELSSLNCPLS